VENSDIFPWLIAFFNTRYQSKAEMSLIDVYAGHSNFLQWDSDQLDALFRRRKAVVSWAGKSKNRERLAYYLAEMTLAFTHHRNQFLPFSQDHIKRLQHIYGQAISETLHLLQTAEARNWQPAYRMLLKCHFVRLQAIMASLLPPALQQRWIYRDALASEYSPEWQLKVLGGDSAELGPPILDLGCGKMGNLVAHLRALGIDAYGLDRFAEGGPGFIRGDWFEFHFEARKWSAIISHLAFSNHFWFHHMNPQGEPERYAKLFRIILESLKPGGTFVYFPSLPFFERLLEPDQYHVRNYEIVLPPALAQTLKAEPSPIFSTHVQRIA